MVVFFREYCGFGLLLALLRFWVWVRICVQKGGASIIALGRNWEKIINVSLLNFHGLAPSHLYHSHFPPSYSEWNNCFFPYLFAHENMWRVSLKNHSAPVQVSVALSRSENWMDARWLLAVLHSKRNETWRQLCYVASRIHWHVTECFPD